MAGAPLGNDNPAKGALWRAAINRALENRSSRKDRKDSLDALAEVLLKKAEEGEGWALKELGDRMDGKPAQAIIGGGDDDPPVKVVNEIVIRGVDAP